MHHFQDIVPGAQLRLHLQSTCSHTRAVDIAASKQAHGLLSKLPALTAGGVSSARATSAGLQQAFSLQTCWLLSQSLDLWLLSDHQNPALHLE